MSCRILIAIAVLGVAVLVDGAQRSAVAEQSPTGQDTRPPVGGVMAPTAGVAQQIDLRPTLERMRTTNQLTQGRTKIVSAPTRGGFAGFTLYATVDKGRITKWDAIDVNGNNLTVTAASQVLTCTVCIEIDDGSGKKSKTCYEVSCDDLPKPKAAAIR